MAETREERRKRLGEASRIARAMADQELAAAAGRLHQMTRANLAALTPQVADPAAYEELIKAVEAATAHNEDLAQFRARLAALGPAVQAVAKVATKLLG